MKANKFFAIALTALAFVGFTSCNNETKDLELTESSITMKVGETHQLVANVTVETWASSDDAVATVDDKGLVTAVAEGTAIVSATANGKTKTCVVKVGQGGSEQSQEVKGSQIWPIILDGVTYAANESKVVASFQPNDVDQFLYVWEGTYIGGEAAGMNAMGNSEGYTSLSVGSAGWSGAGFNLNENAANMAKCRELRDAIVADPDNYFLHMAIKSTDQGSHTFYVLNSDLTKFVMGTPFDGGTAVENFTRDGKWYHYDIPMAQYANALASADLTKGANVFVMLSGGTPGIVLNLDAVYFYKK